MTLVSRPALRRRLLSALLALGAPVLASAQTASEPATTDGVTKLKPFEVNAEQSSGYRVSSASTATRTNTALIDIPQTVDIVTKEFWNDTSATTFDQSFRYVANVYVRNRFAGSGDGVNLRGFETNGSISVDGVRVGNYKRDLTGYERLEVVKGPPSAVQGRAGGTGLLNYILKKPEFSNSASAKYSVEADEYDGMQNRVEIDGNRVLNQSGTLSVRVAGAYTKGEEYIKFNEVSSAVIYPSIRWKPTAKTDIVLTNELLKTNTPSRDEGHGFAVLPEKLRRLVPAYDNNSDPITALHLPYNFNAIGPDNRDKEKVASHTLFITQQILDWLAYRQVAHWHYNGADSASYTSEDNVKVVPSQARVRTISVNQGSTTQGDLIANYKWREWLSGSTLTGYAYSDSASVADNYAGVPDAPFNTLDLAAEIASGNSSGYFNGRKVSVFPRTSYNRTRAYNFGMYAQQDLGFFHDHILLSGGIRTDHDHTTTVNLLTNAQSAGSDTTLNSYRYGITLKISPQLAIYAVKSVQNDATRSIQRYNGLLAGDPRLNEFFTVSPQTELKEVGVKGEFLGGRITASGDYWEMTKTGSVVNILTNGTSQGQNVTFGTQTEIQGAMSKGYEFSAFGSLTNRLSLIANYTRMITGQQRAGSTLANDRVPLRFAPTWNANLFAKYSFQDNRGQGFTVKGGVSGIGPFWAQVTGPGLTYIPHRQKSLDFGLGYRWKKYDFDLLATNLDNDPYLITRDQAPRTYHFSVATKF
jgi:outer membrane receptor protein involved in Fe transport